MHWIKRQFAVTFGPQPWTLRCVLALDLQRVVHSELRCVIENSFLFGCAKHESARRSIRRNQFRWFIFNEDSYLSEAVKFLTGSIETVELICLFLWFQIRLDLRCLASQVSNIRMHCLSVINQSSNASPGLFLASKQIASFIPYSFLINLEMLAVQGPTTVASLVRWWK